MLTFRLLEYENFFSYEYEHLRLDLDTITLIEGFVTDEQGHDSNGAGKSTIWDAFFWCLTGETLRTIRGSTFKYDEIIRRNADDGAYALIVLDIEDVSYTVVRARKHSKWRSGLHLFRGLHEDDSAVDISKPKTSETQEYLYQLLGMTRQGLRHSIFFDDTRFTELSPTEQMSMIESFLEVDLESYRLLASKKLTQLESDRTALESQAEILKSKVEEKIAARKEQIKLSKEFEAQRQKSRKKLVGSLSALKESLNTYRSQLRKANTLSAKLSSQLEQCRSLGSKLDKKRQKLLDLDSKLSQSVSKLSERESQFQERLTRARAKIRWAKDHDSVECPQCTSIVSADLVESHFQELISDLEQKLSDVQAQRRQLKKKRAGLEKKQNAIDKKLEEVDDKIWKTEESLPNVDGISSKIELVNSSIETSSEQLKDLDDQKNNHSETAKRISTQLKEIRTELQKHSQSITDLDDDIVYWSFWVDALRASGKAGVTPVRSFVVSSVIDHLNSVANKISTSVTDGELRIHFDTETELKSGDSRDKFSVTVSKRLGSGEYGTCSAGERRRADICISAALQSLVASRSSRQTSLSVFDETFSGMDESGIERIVDMLQQLPTPTFVISHRSGLKDSFPNSWKVVKKNGISKVYTNDN